MACSNALFSLSISFLGDNISCIRRTDDSLLEAEWRVAAAAAAACDGDVTWECCGCMYKQACVSSLITHANHFNIAFTLQQIIYGLYSKLHLIIDPKYCLKIR